MPIHQDPGPNANPSSLYGYAAAAASAAAGAVLQVVNSN
jgi:hypothetical protein